ncbi:HD domain-containing protein [Aureispira anguillae]|uniref:HD domain-containing protein n=1 Tax=Aureispira anguillae TaxID=2864201 RepID=A0A915VKA2_9BACT|nr:hypothetical protein [Aureispira anguillae]BDS09583.1 hypothetical protein AsAng_0002870 [Aureispira anguillae]
MKLSSPFSVISIIEKIDSSFIALYNRQIRHYKLREHTFLVLSEFFKYFGHLDLSLFDDKEGNWFKYLLALHDIGKPMAMNEKGFATKKKYIVTKKLITKLSVSLGIKKQLPIILALVEHDSLGKYFQGKSNLDKTIQTLANQAEQAGLGISDYFRYKFLYYQCDLASYTEDAGGQPFLEHLFIYEDGRNKKTTKSNSQFCFCTEYTQKLNVLVKRII